MLVTDSAMLLALLMISSYPFPSRGGYAMLPAALLPPRSSLCFLSGLLYERMISMLFVVLPLIVLLNFLRPLNFSVMMFLL